MSNRPMRAHEIVKLFASLQKIDLATIANVVGNMPRANVLAWLSGKKDNLRQDSVVRLLDMIGLKIGNGVYLDPSRVHMWEINDNAFRSAKTAYRPLTVMSRLLKDCAITRVEPPKRSWIAQQTCQVYLVSGRGIKVVIKVAKAPFKASRISPEWLVGTLWRDPVDMTAPGIPHSIVTTAEKWQMLMDRDLAPFEFDQIFEQMEPKLNWKDVAMAAREYAVTPDMIYEKILREHGPGPAKSHGDEENSMPLADGIILLRHEVARRAGAGR